MALQASEEHVMGAKQRRSWARRAILTAVVWGGSILGARAAAPDQTADQNGAWQPIGLSGGGAMFTPAVSPVDKNLVMLNCDMSCAFLSRDGGQSWRMIHHGQLRSNIRCRPALHPRDPNVIYAADSAGMLRVTRDQGHSWNPLGNLRGLEGLIAIDPDLPDRMLSGAQGWVWQSEDAGKTWSRRPGPLGRAVGFHFDRTSPADQRTCFAATDQGVWRSDDGGRAWAEASDGLPWRNLRSFAGGSSRASGMVLLYCAIPSEDRNGFQGGVYRSADRGKTWSSAMGAGINKETRPTAQWADGPIAQYHHVLTTDVKPGTVYTFNTSTGFPPPHHATVYRSDDAGEHWRATFYPDPRFPGYNVEPNYTTATLNQSFPSVAEGAAIAPSDPDYVIHVTSHCYTTSDGGLTWKNGDTRPVQQRIPRPTAERILTASSAASEPTAAEIAPITGKSSSNGGSSG
jgi:photosystem II stability/assembly factor-like uncharacterized protein